MQNCKRTVSSVTHENFACDREGNLAQNLNYATWWRHFSGQTSSIPLLSLLDH